MGRVKYFNKDVPIKSIRFMTSAEDWITRTAIASAFITPRACARGKVIGRVVVVVTPRACARGKVIGCVCC